MSELTRRSILTTVGLALGLAMTLVAAAPVTAAAELQAAQAAVTDQKAFCHADGVLFLAARYQHDGQ